MQWELLMSKARGIMDGGLCVLGKKASPSVPAKNGIFVVVQIGGRIVTCVLECNAVPSCLLSAPGSLAMEQPGVGSFQQPRTCPRPPFLCPFLAPKKHFLVGNILMCF